MRNIILRFCAAASISFLVACGGGGPIGKAIDHRSAMISIVEANKTDAAAAVTALEKYVKDNQAALDALAQEMEAFKKEVGDDKTKMMDAAKSHIGDIASLMEREQALRKEAGDVWRDDKVRELMGKARAF